QHMKDAQMKALQETETAFTRDFQAHFQKQQEALERIQKRAHHTLQHLRESTSHKLSAYEDRQSDPFYRLVDIDADLFEDHDAFVLTAKIPVHERDHISVTVRDNEIVLSGYRRNEESLDRG